VASRTPLKVLRPGRDREDEQCVRPRASGRASGRAMLVERQGTYECFLATIGALVGESLVNMRGHAECLIEQELKQPLSWGALTKQAGENETLQQVWWRVAKTLLTRYNLPLTLASVPAGAPDNPTELPPQGKGTVLVSKRGTANHIMPFEDGYVWDPCDPHTGVSLERWLRDNPGWGVLTITLIEDSKSTGAHND